MQPAGEFVAVFRDLFLDEAGQGIGVDRLSDHVAVALRPQRVKEFILAARRGVGAGLGRQAEHRARTSEILRFALGHQVGQMPVRVINVHVDLPEFGFQRLLAVA